MTTIEAPTRRTLTVPVQLDPETRSDGPLKLSGLAAPYERKSLDIGFTEVIERGAFADSIRRDDMFLLWQHNSAQPLARSSAGNLEVRDTPEGVRFTATLPNTSLARDAVELVRSGTVNEMSFGFVVEQDTWEVRDGERVRVVQRGRLAELSLVSLAAYGKETSVSARNRELASRIERTVAGIRRPTVDSPYTPTGPHSYFRDLMVIGEAKREWDVMFNAGYGPTLPRDGFVERALPHVVHGDVAAARARLKRLADEQRDLTTSATNGGGFVGTPQHIGEAFAASARARGVLPSVLPVHPLPERGMSIKTPRMTTGASTEVVATENVAVNSVDIVEAAIESPVSTIAGFEDLSQALLDRAEPGMDTVIATELGRAIAEDLDLTLLNGSGSAPYLRGLLQVSGITTVTFTASTPTAAEFLPKLAEAAAKVGSLLGSDPTHVLWHPRRAAWFASNLSSTFPLAGGFPLGLTPVSVPAISTILGSSTNEDHVIVIRADELPIYLGPISFRVQTDHSGSSTLTARCTAWQYASALFARRPEAIAVVSGTGLAAWF